MKDPWKEVLDNYLENFSFNDKNDRRIYELAKKVFKTGEALKTARETTSRIPLDPKADDPYSDLLKQKLHIERCYGETYIALLEILTLALALDLKLTMISQPGSEVYGISSIHQVMGLEMALLGREVTEALADGVRNMVKSIKK